MCMSQGACIVWYFREGEGERKGGSIAAVRVFERRPHACVFVEG